MKTIYLTTLYKKTYRLKKPLKLLLTEPKTEKDAYILEFEKGNVFIYSHSNTLKKAIRNFRYQLIDLYKELIDIPDKEIGPVLVETKNFLKEYIEERK